MEKGRLGKSRKYPIGSVHEIASGKFEIMERYRGEDGKAWLKYQWLTGEKVGEIEDNKEENVNASTYKFRQSRGITDIDTNEKNEIKTLNQVYELLEKCYDILANYAEKDTSLMIEEISDMLSNHIVEFRENTREREDFFKKYYKILDEQKDIMREQESQIKRLTTMVDSLTTQFDLASKLIDKLK